MDGDRTKLALLEQSMERNTEEHKGIHEQLKTLGEKMDKFIESADQRYADKETEKIVKGVGWLIFVAFVSALIYLIGWGK